MTDRDVVEAVAAAAIDRAERLPFSHFEARDALFDFAEDLRAGRVNLRTEPGPVVGAGMDVAGTPTAGAQTYAPDTQTGPAGVPEEKTR